MNNSTSFSAYSCNFCQSVFMNPSDLEVHLTEVHLQALASQSQGKTYESDLQSQKRTHQSDHRNPEMVPPQKKPKNEYMTSQILFAKIMKDEEKVTPISCEKCPRSFVNVEQLQFHHKLQHSDENPGEVTDQQTEKNRNVKKDQAKSRTVDMTPNVMLTCTFCRSKFSDRDVLQEHTKTVHNVKLFCQFCPSWFGTESKLQNHMKKHAFQHGFPNFHTKMNSFRCEHCPVSFFTMEQLDLHRKLQHRNDFNLKNGLRKLPGNASDLNFKAIDMALPLECPFCRKKFAYRYELKEHIGFHNKTKTKLFCQFCPAWFGSENRLKDHLKRHELMHDYVDFDELTAQQNEANFSGNVANQSEGSGVKSEPETQSSEDDRNYGKIKIKKPFKPRNASQKAALSIEKIFKCNDCQKTFKSENDLTVHQAGFGILKFVCSFCPYWFRTECKLMCHLKVHLEQDNASDKPFKCSECLKVFHNKNEMTVHQAGYGILKYVCSFCPDWFRTECKLTGHLKMHLQTENSNDSMHFEQNFQASEAKVEQVLNEYSNQSEMHASTSGREHQNRPLVNQHLSPEPAHQRAFQYVRPCDLEYKPVYL